ncbi:hypothetical protein DNAM5_29 [Haloarcula californiae tailed virus 1]|uniref:Uncharacterized protein n=1 Tax=Haloarcula californiae tailed virus 1 TaxID=1273746 RepID=R4TMG3_9CAUD|nr:hypothetical protein M202_gp029 [Haloarcula californiae tailed virus 1]AGM11892.1 hypothetical protein DNAM5_29 [Haloarcula californiae tailed virus 1]
MVPGRVRLRGGRREMADDANDDARMNSNVEINSVPLDAVSDAGEDAEVLGFAVMSTTGELVVPREWLQEQWEQYDLPDEIFPSETWASSAYKRSMFHLLDNGQDEQVMKTDAGKQKVSLDVKDGAGNQRHVLANTWFSADHPKADQLEIDESGEWRQATLGITNYDAESQKPVLTQAIDDAHPLADIWEQLESRIRELYDTHKVSHNGDDMRDVLYDFTRYYSDSIPLRDGGAVYFVPANDKDTIEALAEIWDKMDDEFKLRGRETEIQTIPVVSDTERKELVEKRAMKVVRDEVDRVLEDAFDDLEDPDDETPEDEIVSTIEKALGDHAQTADVYNSLVDARIEIRDVLQDFASDISSEARQDLIESTLERLSDEDVVTDGGQERDENGRFA